IVDHSDQQHYQEVKKAAPVDIILEMLDNQNLGDDLPLLNSEGRVVVIGSRGTVEINPRELMSKDACFMRMSMFNA
ncbi:NADPH:quinone reductase, partial [Psychromonas aquatilis]